MAKHTLSLDVIESLNCNTLRIDDTSVYTDLIPIECPILSITTPGANYSVEFGEDTIQSGFRFIATACNLELQSENCGTTLQCLPDGIYVLKYSVSPNDQVFVEYNHLRVCKLKNNYDKVLCELDLSNCEPSSETEKKLKLLHEIDMYIKAAVAKVEICHEPEKGMQLYTYAKNLLSKFACTSCN
jgi:hypothetical protein